MVVKLSDAVKTVREEEMKNFTKNSQIEINQKEIENCYEFRLQEIALNSDLCNNTDLCDEIATSISSYSNHKQRIDAMFDDGKSLISNVSSRDKNKKIVIANQYIRQKARKENLISNEIQEKIEKMFEEISLSASPNISFTGNKASQKKKILGPFLSPLNSAVKEDFKVTYLGSKPLKEKTINLAGLQNPLKELYFMYKKKPTEFMTGMITICEEGLTIKTMNKEKLNPFSTIAVWASVKLAFRTESGILEYAFLPLIANPDGTDKDLLFKQIDSEDKNLCDENQCPIFAIVMKNLNLNKQLECHGFICNSSEEAIVIAANLYHALIKKLRRKRKHKEEKIKECNNKNTVSNTEEHKISETNPKIKIKKAALPAPAKPPRKFQQTERKHTTLTSEAETFDALNHHWCKHNEQKVDFQNISQRRGSVPDTLLGNRASVERKLRRAVSDCGENNMKVKNKCEGDILTKVAIPRSQSFLNANGPLQRFSRTNKTHTKNEVLSPLGFNELFNEFRLHEGLKSMDEILNVIIDAEGMSFNDLKPIYKDFLLKLAVILTKDELYHRSKVIMKRQKRKNKKCKFKKELIMSSVSLKKMFNRASKKKKTKNIRPSNLEFTSVVFQSFGKHWESKSKKINRGRSKFLRVKLKPNHRRKWPKRVTSTFHSTTSEDSDVSQSIKNINRKKLGHNMSSSGYFSYSDCGYDSEDCTCSSTNKCYCTLSERKLDVPYNLSSQARSRLTGVNSQPKINREHDDSLKTCSCDTISCADSGKCYCMRRENRKFYRKSFHPSDIKEISQASHFLKRGTLHSTSHLRHIENGNIKPKNFILHQLKNDIFRSANVETNILANTWRGSEKISKQRRHCKRNRKTEFLPIQTLTLNHPIEENLSNFKCYSNSEDRHFKEFQDSTKEIGSQNFEGLVNGHYNEDLVREMTRVRNAHTILKSTWSKRQYSSLRCRNECLSDLTISKPFYRTMSYRTKRLFGSVRYKRSCNDIMNHIKFPNTSYSNSSLRFRRRMDVYDSFSESKVLSLKSDSTYHSQRKKNIVQNLPQKSYKLDNPSEELDWDKSTGNLQRSEAEVFAKINHAKLDSTLNQIKKKMLIVSARDPKGKVLFMGASNNKCDSVRNFGTFLGNDTKTNAGEALAVKKSAEIASLFSNSLVKQKISHAEYVSDEKEYYQERSKSYELEHSLGYLP